MSTMLPAIPRTFGRLSDVFASCLGSITGADNRLGFASSKRVVAILVDGLGAQNLKAAGGHAPHLNKRLADTKPIACGFPSTTASSITSFATGTSVGTHGLVGYKVFDREAKSSFNLLNGWDDSHRPEDWQREQTVTSRALTKSVGAFAIGPKAYEDSAFTRATMSGAKYLAGKTIADRFELAKELLRSNREDWICYLYVPELDQAAHSAGVSSAKWLALLEEVEGELRGLERALERGDSALLTADHGVVDVAANSQIYLDEAAMNWARVMDVSGDPRVNFVYLSDDADQGKLQAQLQDFIGETGLVLTKQQVMSAGWYGHLLPRIADRLPELFVMATKNVAYYHRGYAPAASLNMIGQHGALSGAEMSIPLLGFGGYSKI